MEKASSRKELARKRVRGLLIVLIVLSVGILFKDVILLAKGLFVK